MREMKDSGIEWIGEIPDGWEVGRIKYNTFLKGRIGWQGLKADEFIDEGPFLVTGTDFCNGKVDWDKCYHISFERYNEAPEIHLKAKDLLITKDGTVGKLAYIDYVPSEASLNSHLLLIRPINKLFTNIYLFWIFTSEIFKYYTGLSQNGTIMDSLSQEKINNFNFPLPSLHEQSAIVNYLDNKCGKIDVTIQREKQHIEKLKEYRQSVIMEAVTKGLDPTVPMKDSGIKWIGQVPQEWKIVRLRFLCYIATGSKDTVNRVDDGQYPFYVRSPNVEKINSYSFDGEAILMAGDGVGAGKVFHYANGKFDYHQRVYNLHYFKTINAKYLFYYLCENFWKEIEQGNAKSTVDSIRLPMILNFPICVANEKEQASIADYLDRKTTQIDSAIAKKEMLIEKLTEYKKSLIYEAVTGKMEVY